MAVDARACVFCGIRPTAKTKEHVIPKWLIALTGNPKRIIGIHPLDVELAFDQFTFPACDTCNHSFSSLETRAQVAFSQLSESRGLNSSQAVDLLDWFDKVRIGLWLGGQILTKGAGGITPRFAIGNRLRATDRLLYIGSTSEQSLRLTFSPIVDPFFMAVPSFFYMYANGLAFVSAASSHIAGRALGLPHLRVENLRWGESGVVCDAQLRNGSHAEYGRHFPVPADRFSLLAQAILSSGQFPLPEAARRRLLAARMDPCTPSQVHVFRKGGPAVLSAGCSRVMNKPWASRDKLMLDMIGVWGSVRSWFVSSTPDAADGRYSFASVVAAMEKASRFSSLGLIESVPKFFDSYGAVAADRTPLADWQARVRAEALAARDAGKWPHLPVPGAPLLG